MRVESTTVRLMLVLASLALHSEPVLAAKGGQSSLEQPALQSRSFPVPIRMSRMLKRFARPPRPLSKRRKHNYDEGEEDWEQEEEDYPRRARQYLSSSDVDEGRSGSLANRAPPASESDEDQIVADPNGDVEIKPARVVSSATSATLEATSAVPNNAKGTLLRAASIISSTEDEPTSTPAMRKVRTSSSEASETSETSTVTASEEVTVTTSLSAPSAITTPSSTSTSRPASTTSALTSSSSSSTARQTSTATNNDANDDQDSNAIPYTGIWSAFNKQSRWFPIAIVLTILIGMCLL